MVDLNSPLFLYAIYENTHDFPGLFVMRQWAVTGSPVPIATGEVYAARTLDEVRAQIPHGLTCHPRHPNDDRCILESWM